jgi:hypothetical protein
MPRQIYHARNSRLVAHAKASAGEQRAVEAGAVKAIAIIAVCSSLLHFLLWRREVARHAETRQKLVEQLVKANLLLHQADELMRCRPYTQGQAKITLH